MRVLRAAIASVVLIAVGVGGTLGVQHFTGRESADCDFMNRAVHGRINADYGEGPTQADLTRLDTILDIRYKVCHP